MHRPSPAQLALVAMLASSAAIVSAQQGDGTNVSIAAHVFKPDKVDATPARIAQLKVPAGFRITAFATGLKNARIVAVAEDGRIYVSRRDTGDVLMLEDRNGDGVADGPARKVLNRPGAHGLAIRDRTLYLVTVKELFSAPLLPDGSVGELKLLMGDLPDAGQHANRTIAFGPDGMLYISVGSTCNACNESNPENATLLRATPDGQSRTIFARGLRNTIGFDWHPVTGELWGMDHGIDYLGDEEQQEELNRIEMGKQYGWPHIWGAGGVNPQSTPEGEVTKAQWKALSTPMVMGYTAHAAPMQMVFAKAGNGFPAQYAGDAFVTMRGSWNRKNASGYEIVRIHFENGQPKKIEPFVTGFLTDRGRTHIARPVGLAWARDGALLMADDANGVLYRVAYAGASTQSSGAVNGAANGSGVSAPRQEMERQANQGQGEPLTKDRPETAARGAVVTLQLTSPSFAHGQPMPQKHSEYAEGVSPALAWAPVAGAKSYAIVVEDPDSKPITPFVHWVAWNIPASTIQLPEGLQEQGRLTEPAGLLQGRNSRGSIGYYGPRPPAGDAPHHYHFQILALDTVLDVALGASRDEVLAAARGHVIGKAELVGTFEQTTKPPK